MKNKINASRSIKIPQVAYIGIGNELLQGKIVDKNLSALAKILFENNMELSKAEIVADDGEKIKLAFSEALQAADLVIASGGLGPTADDITKDCLAQFLDVDLIETSVSRNVAEENYSTKGKEYQDMMGYHLIPEGVTPIPNTIGYAPGIFWKNHQKGILLAPGVPREFTVMAERFLKDSEQFKTLNHRENLVFRTWNVPESHIFNQLVPELWDKLSEFGPVSSLPHAFSVDVGVTLEAPSIEELNHMMEHLGGWVKNTALAPHIWQIGQTPLPDFIIEKAKKKSLKISCAESCTGGLIGDSLTNIPGSSQVFQGGFICYTNQLKHQLLGVALDLIQKHTEVSGPVAESMAKGALIGTGSDISVATTGYAGPTGGTAINPVGTIFIGVASKCKDSTQIETKSFRFVLKGDRVHLKTRFTEAALHFLREEISLFDS